MSTMRQDLMRGSWFVAAAATTVMAATDGCGTSASYLNPSSAVELVISELAPEENAVAQVCADLDDPTPDQAALDLRALPENVTATNRLLSREVRSNLGALLQSINVDTKRVCNVDEVIQFGRDARSTTGIERCRKEIDARLADAKNLFPQGSGEAARTARIYSALVHAKIDSAATILADPVRAGRAMDMSPAVLIAFMRIGEGSEKIADDLASGIPYLTGLAKIAARKGADALTVAAMDIALAELEKTALVNPASLARNACQYYRVANSRESASGEVLRRAILRLRQEQWKDPLEFPPNKICRDLENALRDAGLGGSPCREMNAKLFPESLREPQETDAYVPPPRITAAQLDAEERPEDIAKIFREATDFCSVEKVEVADMQDAGVAWDASAVSHHTYGVECTMTTLNELAGILRLYDLRGKDRESATATEQRMKEVREHFASVDARLQQIASAVEQTRQQLANVGGGVESLSKTMASRFDRTEESLRQVTEMAGRLLECKKEFARTRLERLKFAKKTLGICKDANFKTDSRLCSADLDGPRCDTDAGPACDDAVRDFCEGDTRTNAEYIGAAGPATGPGIRVSLSRSSLCDVSNDDFVLNFRTDGAFAPCGTTLNAEAVPGLNAFANAIVGLRPDSIDLLGHADSRLPGQDCHHTNDELSNDRAFDVERRMREALGATDAGSAIGFDSKGLGAQDQVITCKSDTDETCHEKNRRVTFILHGGNNLMFHVRACALATRSGLARQIDAGN